MIRIIARMLAFTLAFTLLASTLAMGSEGEGAVKHKKRHAAGPTVEEQLRQLRNQLDEQQGQIKDQQDHIQKLEQDNTKLQQQIEQNHATVLQQNQQLQNSVQAADQKAAAAQASANAVSSNVAEVKASTEAVSNRVAEDQKIVDKLANPDKYLPEPKVVLAAAPVRVLPIDPPVKNGLVPAFRIGGVHVAPYGFLKATGIEDSSSPHGDDFPLPGFLPGITNTFGPTMDPNFHVKARSSRFGANFEFHEISPKLTLTGRAEADFEGNFSRVDNRNVSTYRSPMLSLRLAFARLDYAASEKTDIFFQGGQDWTLFGSGALPNLLETTFLGAYFGSIYERAPQMTLGFTQKLGGSRGLKFTPEFAIMAPLQGLPPAAGIDSLNTTPGAALGNQLGYGERQGADANTPELEARAVLQFQLDKTPGVPSAELMVSGFKASREAIVLPSQVPAAFTAAFPNGASASSDGNGVQVAAQLPTRWATLTVSAYRGADLRFFFGGQFTSIYNDTSGLTSVATASSIDGSTTQAFGFNSSGVAVLAPQRSVRGYGGFINLGLPLSKWFNADPRGHNAGWQLYLHYGEDAVNATDFRRLHDGLAAGPVKSTVAAATLYYKINQWATFAAEESLYRSYAVRNSTTGTFVGATNLDGAMSGKGVWRDVREEFGPVFTF